MAMNNAPFIGVCGIRSAAEYTRLVNISRDKLAYTGRFLMAGVKDINGDLDTIKLSEDVRLFVHCDYDSNQAYSTLVLDRLRKSRHYARGLQLNVVPWMETDFSELWEMLHQEYPRIALVLQVHRDVMERYTPEQIAHRLRQQRVDYVLFDASQSRGIPYDPIAMHRYVRAIYEQDLSMRVVVSGGLGSDTVESILQPLAASFRELSCDAFHHLQNRSTKQISWPNVEKYLTASQHILKV
jgi:hypothetical protein